MTNEEFAASKDWLAWDRPSETLKRVPGTSPLTTEQADWYAEHFGIGRYLSVQEQPQRPSRKWRRSRRKDDLG